jgi:hypothetical protein
MVPAARASCAFSPIVSLLLILVLGSMVPARPAAAWTWLPGERTLPAPTADPREPGLGFGLIENNIVTARVGHAFAIGRTRPDGGVEAGLDGLAWLWFSTQPRLNFPLETIDGTFALWAGARGDRVSWRLRLAHWSGHLADGASDIEDRRFVYSRESLTGLAFWDANPHLQLYGGPGFFVRADPPTPAFQWQMGGELRPDRATRQGNERRPAHVDPFLAIDFRAKAENAMRVNQSYRAGVRLAGAPGGNALRIALGYDSGRSERGQFWQTTENYLSFGLSFGD